MPRELGALSGGVTDPAKGFVLVAQLKWLETQITQLRQQMSTLTQNDVFQFTTGSSELLVRSSTAPPALALETDPFFYIHDQTAAGTGDIWYIKGQTGDGDWRYSYLAGFPDTTP